MSLRTRRKSKLQHTEDTTLELYQTIELVRDNLQYMGQDHILPDESGHQDIM